MSIVYFGDFHSLCSCILWICIMKATSEHMVHWSMKLSKRKITDYSQTLCLRHQLNARSHTHQHKTLSYIEYASCPFFMAIFFSSSSEYIVQYKRARNWISLFLSHKNTLRLWFSRETEWEKTTTKENTNSLTIRFDILRVCVRLLCFFLRFLHLVQWFQK